MFGLIAARVAVLAVPLGLLGLPAGAAAAPPPIDVSGTVVHDAGGRVTIAAPGGALTVVRGRAPFGRSASVPVAWTQGAGWRSAGRALVRGPRGTARLQGTVTHRARGALVLSAPGTSIRVRTKGVVPAVGSVVSVVADLRRSSARELRARSLRVLARAPGRTVAAVRGRVLSVGAGRLVLTADDAGASQGRLVLAASGVLPAAGTLVDLRAELSPAGAQRSLGPARAAAKVTLCHATGSPAAPYVTLTVAAAAVAAGHGRHADDLIPAPAGGCPSRAGGPPSTPPDDPGPPGGGGGGGGFGSAGEVCKAAGLPAELAFKAGLADFRDGKAALGGGFSGVLEVSGEDRDTLAFALAAGSPGVDGVLVHAGEGRTLARYEYDDAREDGELHGPLREGRPNVYATVSFVVLCGDGSGGGDGGVVEPPPAPGHDHLVPATKVEEHRTLAPGQTGSVRVACPAGTWASDGMVRVDDVDAGTGGLAAVRVLALRRADAASYEARVRNDASGDAQVKAIVVCVVGETTPSLGHVHPLDVSGPRTTSGLLAPGRRSVTLTCAEGGTPVAPGWTLTGGDARLVGSAPSGPSGWTLTFDVTAAAALDAGIGCLQPLVGSVGGHVHRLGLTARGRQVVVPPGQVVPEALSCEDDGKAIVAGAVLAPGLVGLGNDPQPKIRVFRLLNPTGAPLVAALHVTCLADRVGEAAPAG